MQRIILAAVVLFTSSTLLTAQSPTPARFEVASVKADPKQDRGGPVSIAEITLGVVRVLPGGRIESYGNTLRNLIAWAYEVNTIHQKIEGKQEPLETEFNISAKAAADSLTSAAARVMVRALLEERFQLRWRLQPRAVDGYLLMPAREDGRPGPGLRAFTGDCAARANNTGVRIESPEFEQQGRCGWTGINSRQRAVGVSMNAIAERLTLFMATPVTDRTGWPGLFTFDVIGETRNMPSQTIIRSKTGLGEPRPSDAPELLDVFRAELGLRLVKERTTINDFVVERVEPLIEN